MDKLTIYHGSKDIVERPIFGFGNPNDDYGLGFYCTESLDMAKEWAVTEGKDGFANKYSLEMEGMKVLNLSSPSYNIIHWLTLLLANRKPILNSPIAEAGREYLLDNFLIPIDGFDVIIGYRADDSYFSFARAFLNNTISLKQLSYAMRLGKLGEQIVLKSEQAFSSLLFLGYERVQSDIYFPLRRSRDLEARESYRKECQKGDLDGIFLRDIIREEIKESDERLF